MEPRTPTPTRTEEIALFRLSVVGDLVLRDLEPGELSTELKQRADRRYRPPGASASRRYHWKTLQSWLYSAREGLSELAPASRRKGFALELTLEQRSLLLDMREEHPSAAADLLLGEAVRHGAIPEGIVSPVTVRRLLHAHGASRGRLNRVERRKQRLRWESPRVGDIWHADVCHIWLRDPEGKPYKAYVHGLLDDHSRYVPVLEAREHEREVDMLAVLVASLLRFPAPGVLFVDNGSCYRGEVLALTTDRLGVRLLHAQPHDPQARGKMERFWRTMRQRCTDHLPPRSTLADLNTALLAWLDADYHLRPHAGLLGETPMRRFQEGLRGLPGPRSAAELARALVVTRTVRIRKDATFSLEGQLFEVRGSHLAGKSIEGEVDAFTGRPLSARYQDQDVPVAPCDPAANARRGRAATEEPETGSTSFDPIAGFLAKARRDEGGDR